MAGDAQLLDRCRMEAASRGWGLRTRDGAWDLVELDETSAPALATDDDLEPIAQGLTLDEIAALLAGEQGWAPPEFRLW
jgi:hypothetical protein